MTEKSGLNDLRTPFPKSSIGKLPKGPGVMLDYVGHAVVTNRLLDVDPEWSWEPMGLDEHGLPALDKAGNLWIRLTILGLTRIGVGDGPSAKIAIGDALRNAAMRFGVALDLWSKEELEGSHDQPPPLPLALDLAVAARADSATVESLLSLYESAKSGHLLQVEVEDLEGEPVTLGSLITARGKALRGTA